MDIRILDVDGSLISQKNLLSTYNPEVLNLRDFSLSARLWMSRKTAQDIRKRLEGLRHLNRINLLGSGDFHHLSLAILERLREPFSLIIFDFHPDWDMLPPFMGCGSWVGRALKDINIVKCLLIGPSSQDLSFPFIQTASLNLLERNKLEIYPYEHLPSRVFLRSVPSNRSIRSKKGLFNTQICWSNLKGKDLKESFLALIKTLPVKKTYVSIDKDCLKGEHAFTNWEEGMFSLDELLMMLGLIRDNLSLIGADITGEYSDFPQGDILKKIASSLDHPRMIQAKRVSESAIAAVNEDVNIKIISALSG